MTLSPQDICGSHGDVAEDSSPLLCCWVSGSWRFEGS